MGFWNRLMDYVGVTDAESAGKERRNNLFLISPSEQDICNYVRQHGDFEAFSEFSRLYPLKSPEALRLIEKAGINVPARYHQIAENSFVQARIQILQKDTMKASAAHQASLFRKEARSPLGIKVLEKGFPEWKKVIDEFISHSVSPETQFLKTEREWLLGVSTVRHERERNRTGRLVDYLSKTRDWEVLEKLSSVDALMTMGTVHVLIKSGVIVPESSRLMVAEQVARRMDKKPLAHIVSGNPMFSGKNTGITSEDVRTVRAVYKEREQIAAKALLEATGMHDYCRFFPAARALKRDIVFHCGPTNSGKTHAAMQELLSSSCGIYLAPLRLLALEGYDILNAAGLDACLMTGDNREGEPELATHVSSTVEMMNSHRRVDVAVIDEVQMISNAERGWAWTAAVAGAPADRVILLGSADALPAIERICRITGDTLEVVEHQRRSVLSAIEPVHISGVQKGDAIVAFSRRELFALRETLVSRGYDVAMLYGGLSPEVRRTEAARFRSGEASVLVATDAIGMGLNLPLGRILLASGMKHDGTSFRRLMPSEIRQICGRAGRNRIEGEAGFLLNAPGSIRTQHLQEILNAKPEPFIELPFVSPPYSAIETVARKEGHEKLPELLLLLSNQAMQTSDFRPADLTGMIRAARTVDDSGLSLSDRHSFSMCPMPDDEQALLREWADLRYEGNTVPVPEPSGTGLENMEAAGKRLVAWLWLSSRFPDTFRDIEEAVSMRERIEEVVKDALRKRRIPEFLEWKSDSHNTSTL